ncbi:hypothetical protein K6V18_16540 [Ralstonia insidiosa]|nr:MULTISPECIES: hypothetical protein [Ralstonia]MBY4706632.1 hypothetical protein [Ralstonia insidiosa]
MKRMNDFGDGVHAVGSLTFFMKFCPTPEIPHGMPISVAALTCSMNAASLASLPEDLSPATMTFESVVLGRHPVIKMKLSVGELEVLWLADAQDQDTWQDIYLWKESKFLPIVIGVELDNEWVYRTYMPEMPDCAMEEPRELLHKNDMWGDVEPWASMVEYAKGHQAAYPYMTNRVPPVPRPDDMKDVKLVLSPSEWVNSARSPLEHLPLWQLQEAKH